jgi:3-hydroxybutyryl-CoA dehydrogenase
MGNGIAYVAAVHGYRVTLTDADRAALERALAKIRAAFDKGVERGKLSADERDEGLRRLTCVRALDEVAADAEVVIEAIPERMDLKQRLFADLEGLCPTSTILASNTSSLSITELASVVRRRGRVIGLHFFNPVPAMRLVEVVRGADTDEETVRRARDFATSLGKTPIVVGDSPGFATSRLGVVLGLEAIRMVERGVASAADIDLAMELGYNHPVGPLRLTDIVGLDVRLAIADHLHRALGDDTYRAPTLLRRMVSEGKLGKKSGEGFYRWEGEA